MNVTGIIAEYNPFHKGHAYQIEEAKKRTNADYIVVVMSGNYVQRGVPAITDKFTRAAMALHDGADLVFELPSLWATAASGDFAAGGVAFLDRLGCITHISYGCESQEHALISALAKILAEEPHAFSILLTSYLKEGKSFPLARELALLSYIRKYPFKSQNLDMPNSPIENKALHDILSCPNNILALEYETAIFKRNSSLICCPIMRKGCGYHDSALENDFSSAAGIRKALFERKDISLSHHMKEFAASLLASQKNYLIEENDFSDMLYYKLLSQSSVGFENYYGSSPFLSNRIKNVLGSFCDYKSFCKLVKTKDITYTRVSRLLLHVLLDMTNKDMELGKSLDYIPYFRLLGFQKSAKPLLSKIKKKGASPLITRPAKADALLSKDALFLYKKDVFASNLYYEIQNRKMHLSMETPKAIKNEYTKELVIL